MTTARILFACFLLAHGAAHVVGFLRAWAPTRTTLIGDRVELGAHWIKLVGVLWLIGAVGFGVAGIAALANVGGWPTFTLWFIVGSLTLCALQFPQTRFGITLNVVLVVALLGGERAGWF